MSSRGSHSSCRTDTAVYHDQKHVFRDRPRGFLGTRGQFCAAFYHVPARNTISHCCLDEKQCKVGTRIGSHGQAVFPRTVVAVVKCEDKDGMVTYEARYTNCYDDKMHAEDYLRLDVERGALGAMINDNKVNVITIYITFQPCHLTVKGTAGTREEHSCCETLLTLFRDRRFSPLHHIEICIKPAHIYKADWAPTPVDNQRNNVIKAAAEGVKMLMKSDIEVTRMEESDWKYLLGKVEDTKPTVLVYPGSVRESLDRDIGNVLSDLRIDTTLEKPLSHKCDMSFAIYDDCNHIFKRRDAHDPYFLGKIGQICAAFYHIYESQRSTSSRQYLCLESQACFTSRKSRKLTEVLHDRPKTTVAVVKCQAGDGTVLYEARYTDCHGVGVFAEEFFLRDAQKGDLGTVINRGRARKITLLATWPPRHRSASNIWNPDDSCCEALVKLNVELFKPRQIKFSVKLAHVYKEGWPEHEDDIRIGIKTLVGKCIFVDKMEQNDWVYLLGNAWLRSWDWQPRKRLDEAIKKFLSRIEQEIQQERYICSLLLSVARKH